MKECFYFPHDYNARTDPKLQEVMMDMGMTGIGLYWCVIEQLYEQNGTLAMSSIKSISFGLHVKTELLKKLLTEYGLFENDGECFWSNSVRKRLGNREALSARRKKASKKANQMRWHGASETDCNECEGASDTDDVVIRIASETETEDIRNGYQEASECLPIKGKEKKRNIKESNREKSHTHSDVLERFFRNENKTMLDKLCMDYHTDVMKLRGMAEQIVNEWNLTEQVHESYNDASQHLINLIRIRLNGRNNGDNQESDSKERRQDAALRIIQRMQEDEAAGNPFAAAEQV